MWMCDCVSWIFLSMLWTPFEWLLITRTGRYDTAVRSVTI